MGSTVPRRPFVVLIARDLEVFHLQPRLPGDSSTEISGSLFSHRLQPWAAPQRQAADFWDCFADRTIYPFASVLRECGHSTGVELFHSPTPPEVCRPSGDVIAGVRSTRDYHPRHLPPMVFLKPSTACTSRRLTCSVSYRHHLWDSKNTFGVAFLVFLTGPSEDSPVRDYESRARSPSRRMTIKELLLFAASTRCSNEAFVSSLLLTCHSPDFLQAGRQGGGHSNQLVTPASETLPDARAMCRFVTHPILCKQIVGEEGEPSSTCLGTNPVKLRLRNQPQQLHCPNRTSSTSRKMPRCTVRSLLVSASACGNNNLSTPSCDFVSRSPSALRHIPAASTRCE
jgi:hypothetical protein